MDDAGRVRGVEPPREARADVGARARRQLALLARCTWCQRRPATYSMTRKVGSPTTRSKKRATFGCSMAATACASCWKRWRNSGLASSSGLSSLMATRRPMADSRRRRPAHGAVSDADAPRDNARRQCLPLRLVGASAPRSLRGASRASRSPARAASAAEMTRHSRADRDVDRVVNTWCSPTDWKRLDHFGVQCRCDSDEVGDAARWARRARASV